MSGRWMRWRVGLWNPSINPFLFFLAAFAFGVSVNLASAYLQGHAILSRLFLFGAPALILLAIVAPRIARRWFGTEVRPTVTLGPARQHRWLIALASPGRGIETSGKAIRYHRPVLERAWLLCSRGGETPSEDAALALQHDLVFKGILRSDQICLVVLPVAEFMDPEKVRAAIDRIYDELPEDLDESDVIIDITGGRKTTTAGAFLAGLPEGRHLEIVEPAEVDSSGHGTLPGDPIEIDIAYRIRQARRR